MADSDPMDDSARSVLELFAKTANLSAGVASLHALDWNRFYDFIIHTHRRQLRISDQDVATALFGWRQHRDRRRAWCALLKGKGSAPALRQGAVMIAAISGRRFVASPSAPWRSPDARWRRTIGVSRPA